MRETNYGYHKSLPGVSYDQAVQRTTEALKTEGFGVLTTIDVKDAFKKKLDVDFKRYVILGACNPQLAHKALSADDAIGLLLPCNVVVAETDSGAEVAIQRPAAMFSFVNLPGLRPVADEAEQRLHRVLDRI
ncbi:MAG: DUF302 domain-containing protein [Candidatus Omnitrophica bacterium]|nr:DUF302 domain-containing protein [Candidatus Omnitrophota bacterium]